MDRISVLPDELLIEILSYLPTKAAASTCVLSKRWECLWMWLSKLEFDTENYTLSECERLNCFLDRNLPLHRAPVIESFHLELSSNSCFKPEDVKQWVEIAVSHQVRHLEISYSSHESHACQPNILPSILYTSKSLEMLTLHRDILLDVPSMASLPSLETFQLGVNRYLDGESLGRFLSICPVLEFLLVYIFYLSKMGKITISVQSLQRLLIRIPSLGDVDELEIDTPSLRYLNLVDYCNRSYARLFKKMPLLEDAYVNVTFPHIESLIGSITSVKCLTICSEAVYGGGEGFVFNQLENLTLCTCREYSLNLLVRFLQDSPNLRVLNLNKMEEDWHEDDLDSLVCWNQSSTVLNCKLSNLQTFSWSGYYGRPLERDIAVYILENAPRLETATIKSDEHFLTKFEMSRELSLCSRASTTCQLEFD